MIKMEENEKIKNVIELLLRRSNGLSVMALDFLDEGDKTKHDAIMHEVRGFRFCLERLQEALRK